MRKKLTPSLIAALDIGTSKVHALVASYTPQGIEIIGSGISPSWGLKRGIVTNIDATIQSIQQAVTEAERMAGVKIHNVYTGIAGSHIHSLNSYGAVAIEHQEVTQKDIDRVIEAAQAVAIPADQKVLHVLPQVFMVDHQGEIREPIGMAGVRLETKVHIVTGAINAAQNIVKCIQQCGLIVDDIILEQLASSQAVLTEDEKELGVCLLDIGGGTSDIAVFTAGAIRHTAVIPIAGDQVTHDIAVLFHTPTHSAELTKRQYACALPDLVENKLIEIPDVGDRPSRTLSLKSLSDVVNARYEELFQLVKSTLQSSGYLNQLAAGLVLTGGAADVIGCIALAEKIFKGIPVRKGPIQYQGNKADILQAGSHATGVGLLYYAYQNTLQRTPVNPLQSIYGRMKAWFRNNF